LRESDDLLSARRAIRLFASVGNAGDFPACGGFEQTDGIDTAMAKFAGEVEIVFGPDLGDGALFELLGIVNALLPLIFAGSHAFDPLGGGHTGGGAIGAEGVEHGVRGEECGCGGGVFVEDGFEELLDRVEWRVLGWEEGREQDR
jgi:hypothetical protein